MVSLLSVSACLLLASRKYECPHRVHLLVPDGLWILLRGQFVEGEPDGALDGRSRLLVRAPARDGKLILQLLQQLPRDLLHLQLLPLGELRLGLRE